VVAFRCEAESSPAIIAGNGAGVVAVHALPLASHDAIAFDIGAEALSAALDAYSSVSGISVICDGSLARGRVSAPIRDTMTPRAALEALLQNTGLSGIFTGAGNAIIVMKPSIAAGINGAAAAGAVVPLGAIHVDAPGGAPLPIGSHGLYAKLMEFEMQRVLSRDARAGGHFEAKLRVWVDATGVVRRLDLVTSTAREPLGQAIVQPFKNIRIGPPPPGLPQPVSIRVAVSGD
jgi:TonB family protein